jgi:hypothetical protein
MRTQEDALTFIKKKKNRLYFVSIITVDVYFDFSFLLKQIIYARISRVHRQPRPGSQKKKKLR